MAHLSSLDEPIVRGTHSDLNDILISSPPVDASGTAALHLKQPLGFAAFGERMTPSMPLIVPEMPPWIEQFSSFITSCEPRVMLATIAQAFGPRVDYETSTTKAKITGVVYDANTACLFKVKIYQRGEHATLGRPTHEGDIKRYVVEFQRRSGDVVAFANFYRETLAALGRVVERPFATPTTLFTHRTGSTLHSTVAAGGVEPNVVAPVGSGGDVILDDGTQACLMDMASSSDLDVQRESVRFLASASNNAINQMRLMSHSSDQKGEPQHLLFNLDKMERLVRLLTRLLCSKDKEVVRCTAVLTANLARQAVACSALLPLVPQLLHLLDLQVPSGSINALLFKDVRRQVAHILMTLSVTCRVQLCKDSNQHTAIVTVLEKHRLSEDFALRNCCSLAATNLNVNPSALPILRCPLRKCKESQTYP